MSKVRFTKKALLLIFPKPKIWELLKKDYYEVEDEVSDLIGGYGIEAVTSEAAYDEFVPYTDIIAEYVNLGDPYLTTILWDYRKDRVLLTSVADYCSSLPKRYFPQ